MDYVTRQFINLSKKLRKELRKALSDLRQALQKQTDAISKANERGDTQRSREGPPFVVRAELHVPERVEKDRQTREDRQHRLQIWVVMGTWAAFLAASGYAYVAIRQWREMIAVRHQAQGAVDAAGRSAAAAEQSNANAVASERPWVGIVFGIQEFEKGKNPRFAVQYLNTGRRPAKVTAARARPYTYRVFPEHPFYPQEPSNIASAAIIVPNGSLIHNDPLPFPSDTELAELRKFPREKTYYLYAAIDYEDVLTHAKYWTHGCLQFYPEYGGPFGSWINCPFYNEVGDEKP